MDKPKRKTVEVLDWSECCKFIEEKYGYDVRDYAGQFANGYNPDLPYQDFWHFLCNRFEISNGASITLDNYFLGECEEEWQKSICEHILIEFGEGENRECTFLTVW